MCTSVHTESGFWDDIDASGECPDTGSAKVFNDFLSPKNTSSFTQTVNSSIENGTVFYSQQLTLVMNNMVDTDIAILENLGKGRLAIVVQDNNDNYFVMGHTNGCFLTGGTAATGAAMGDLNGYTLEFTAEEVDAAPLLPTTSAGVPDTTNASFT